MARGLATRRPARPRARTAAPSVTAARHCPAEAAARPDPWRWGHLNVCGTPPHADHRARKNCGGMATLGATPSCGSCSRARRGRRHPNVCGMGTCTRPPALRRGRTAAASVTAVAQRSSAAAAAGPTAAAAGAQRGDGERDRPVHSPRRVPDPMGPGILAASRRTTIRSIRRLVAGGQPLRRLLVDPSLTGSEGRAFTSAFQAAINLPAAATTAEDREVEGWHLLREPAAAAKCRRPGRHLRPGGQRHPARARTAPGSSRTAPSPTTARSSLRHRSGHRRQLRVALTADAGRGTKTLQVGNGSALPWAT